MSAKTILSVAVVAATLAVSSSLRAEDFHWQGKLAAGKTIEIKGVNGGIEASGGAGNEVEVTATKRGRRSDPAEVEIKVVELEGGVTICAVYPSRGGAPNECRPGAGGRMSVRDNDVTVEFHVRVPAGVRFAGRTVNGSIEATGLPGEAEAYTVNGGVKLQAAGHARAETVNGGIRATLGRADWTGPLSFKTVNGGITVELPADAGAEVHAETVNGDITTDFPLTMKGRFSRRRLSGTIGGGGRQLELETVNGAIHLTKAS